MSGERHVALAPGELSWIADEIRLRAGRETTHRHDYQNSLTGTKLLGPGGLEGISPETAVQKRNPFARPAVFLSWFLVDPSRPFAPKASFR